LNDCDSYLGAVTDKYITGKITHAQPNHIDANAKIEVALRDISLMDTASKLISSTTITDAKTFPVSYKLKYNPSDIKPHHTYSVSVSINGPGGKLLFINDVQTLAKLTGSASTVIDVAVIKSKKF
jgi:putative lipoprotein